MSLKQTGLTDTSLESLEDQQDQLLDQAQQKDTHRKRGRFSKSKGKRGEHSLVKMAQAHGLTARRDGWKQVKPGEENSDVLIEERFRVEVKNRESLGEWLWTWMNDGHAHAMALHKNRKPWLVVLPAETFFDIMSFVKATASGWWSDENGEKYDRWDSNKTLESEEIGDAEPGEDQV